MLGLGLRSLKIEEAHNADIPGELDIYGKRNGYKLAAVKYSNNTYHECHEFIAESGAA